MCEPHEVLDDRGTKGLCGEN